jgi:hypothetical protein
MIFFLCHQDKVHICIYKRFSACVMFSFSAYSSFFLKRTCFPMRFHWTLNNYGGKRKWCTVSQPILPTFWTNLIQFFVYFIHTCIYFDGAKYIHHWINILQVLLYEWLSWRPKHVGRGRKERGQGRVSQVYIHVSWPANLGRVTPPPQGQLYRQFQHSCTDKFSWISTRRT